MKSTFSRLNMRVFVSVSVALVSTSCTSGLMAPIIAPIYRQAISANKNYIWNAQVQSAKPPYKIEWTTTLYGDKPGTGSSPAALQIIAHGGYRNWSWEVKAPPSVSSSWNIWRQKTRKLSEVKSSPIPPALDWADGIKRLYKITRYLVGDTPLPMHADVRLVPRGQAYHSSVSLSAPNHVPLAFASWYPASADAKMDSQEKRFHDFREALAIMGGLLEHVELSAGVTAAPSNKNARARAIKDTANAACWNYAVRPALAVGTSFGVTAAKGISSDLANNMALTYKEYPESPVVRLAYAAALLGNGADQFLQQQNIAWPKHGNDVNGINALLGYCHAFLHYAGDIRKRPLPLKGIQPAKFYPIPAQAAVRR